ncbi:MAG: MipA/OmpV family protein [Gammaproteobacteria bacterium]
MPRHPHRALVLLSILLLTLCTAPVLAQRAGMLPRVPPGWRVGIGLAPVVSPVFEGADDYGFSIFPDLRFQYRDRFFASVPEGIRYRAINGPRLKAGPIARIRFGREEDDGGSPFLVSGSVDGLDGLGDVDAAAELGGFVSYQLAAWRARAELRHGLGGHEGVIGDLSLDYTGGARGVRYAVGPRLRFGSADFVDTYFGISAAQSARSGLPRFDADGGLNSVGIGASVVVPYGERLTLVAFGGYDRLLGDIADSPLVEQRGSANQLAAGVSLSWQFDIGDGRP